jgi:tetraacyldisaccharide 4'-kinase
LLDDGLQQKNIKYDLKIVCFNSSDFIGNGFVLPAGPLRESINVLRDYDIVFLNGEMKSSKAYKKIKSISKNLEIFEGKYNPQNLKSINRNKNYLMFCGIGNPLEFENTLLKYKFRVKKKIIFADHYHYSDKEIFSIKEIAKKNKLSIITTEKDYFRLSLKQKKEINFLKVKLKIKNLNRLKKILFDI